MKYLRLICLSSMMTACASDPPPPAQGSEQFVSHDDQYRDVPENGTEQPSTYQQEVNSSAIQTNPKPGENASRESNRVALIGTASATSSQLPTPAPTSVPVQADNTGLNERDRSGATLTPMDQSENDADRKMTQLVRQAVVKDDSLSFTAKNVKIITQNGKITLRGPVNTTQERTAIESAARKIAGTYQVDNLLEVKQ